MPPLTRSGSRKPSTEIDPSVAIVWAVNIRIVVDLPAPLGPSSPKQSAVRHRQVEMVDGGQLTEALDDGAQFDRRRGGGLDHLDRG